MSEDNGEQFTEFGDGWSCTDLDRARAAYELSVARMGSEEDPYPLAEEIAQALYCWSEAKATRALDQFHSILLGLDARQQMGERLE